MLRFQIVLLTLFLALPTFTFAQTDDADLESQFMDDEFAEEPAPPELSPTPTTQPAAATLPPASPDPVVPPAETFPEPEISEPVAEESPKTPPFVEPEGFTDTPTVEETIPEPEIQAEPIPEPEIVQPVAESPIEESAPVVGDDPDLEKEARFHRIYKTFNQQPTPTEQWSSAVGKSSQSTYSVQKGDNLWSLSQTLFADPNFWPKIWSLNSGLIENPHQVLPGQTLQFVPGTMGEAPTLAVTDGTQPTETAAAAPAAPAAPAGPEVIPVLPNGDLDFSKVTVQPSKKKSNPVAPLPRSLPNWKYRGEESKSPLILELTQVNRNFGSPQMVLPYFTTEGELPAFGEIVGTEGGFVSATDYQYVTIKMSEVLAEKTATAVRRTDQVSSSSGYKANVIQVQGELEILEVVNAREGLYRGMVKRSVAPVEVGAKLIAGTMPTYNMKDEGDVMNMDGQVIGGYSYSGKLFGTDSIVYFNRGSRQGAAPGQIINIYKSVPVRIPTSRIIENELIIGKVKVLRTSENFLTGVVLQANEDIRVGDSGIRKQVNR